MATILAADIGGTNSRFGHFLHVDGQEPRLMRSCSVPTASVESFPELLSRIRDEGIDPGQADQVVLAVAGPVRGGLECRLTNAAWGIDLRGPGVGLPPGRSVLVNDFVAQALGSRTGHAAQTAVTVQRGEARDGVLAAIGAGTGLGQCALLPLAGGEYLLLPSEGGHAPLAFVTEEEFGFLRFLQRRTGHTHAFGDIVLSGTGLSSLHLFLTGRELSPPEVAREIGPDSETTRWFARFFGRACRSYALNVLAWGGVSLCGGIAARNPFLVTHGEFLREFTDCPAYASLLAQVPIRLITAPDAGLHGAASHAARLLEKRGEGATHICVS